MRLMKVLALLVALGLTAATAEVPRQAHSKAQSTGTARIRGSVVDASTGMPVRRATMRLRMTPGTTTWTAITDGNGAFEFPALPAGRFTLTAAKGGFVTLGPG